MNPHFTGLVEDPRNTKEKSKDWQAEEVFSAPLPVEWKNKRKWKSYTERNQYGTSSCVAQTMAKLFEIAERTETGKTTVFSATPIYATRANRPSQGMWLQNALEIARNHGITTEERMKSQMFRTDAQMEKEYKKWNEIDTKLANKYAIGGYAFERPNMDLIANHLNQERGVAFTFFSSRDEWSTEFPYIDRVTSRENADVFHAVSLVDYGLIDGKKYLKVEDSAHFGGRSERFLSEDFLQQRATGVAVIFDKENLDVDELPKKFTFTKKLEYGMRQDKDVIQLQNLLKRLGCFRLDIPSTGNYLELTRQAVYKFQLMYNVANLWELNYVNGRWCGNKTIAKLNELI